MSLMPVPPESSNERTQLSESEKLERVEALRAAIEHGSIKRTDLTLYAGGEKRGRKPSALAGMPLPVRYLAEKRMGLRRENGSQKLVKLTARHYKIIGMRLEGKSLEDICRECHVSISTASRVLNDPLAQNLLKKVYANREDEINALAGKAIEGVRQALTGDFDIGTRLRGVAAYVKIQEALVDKEKGRESAEDVVARILQNANIQGDVNIQVNQGVK